MGVELESSRAEGNREGRLSARMRLVDGLRGIAALWVVVFHLDARGHLGDFPQRVPGLADIVSVGTLGVYIFFVLSGFVIAHSVGKHAVTGAFFGRFALRRSVRLDPPYWASMAVMCIVAYLAARFGDNPYEPPSVGQVVAHLFYAQDILGVRPISIVYWTLCLEIQFYLIFCFLLWIAHRARLSPLLVLAPAFVVAAAWPLLHLGAPWPGSWLPFWYGFLCGVLANWGVRGLAPAWAPIAYSAVLALAALRHWLFEDQPIFGLEVATAGAVGALLYATGRTGAVTRWLRWRPLQTLGNISYSLYLTHGPAIVLIYGALQFMAGPDTLRDWRLAGLTLPVVVLGAWLFWWLFERPSLALAKRVGAPSKAPSAAALSSPMAP